MASILSVQILKMHLMVHQCVQKEMRYIVHIVMAIVKMILNYWQLLLVVIRLFHHVEYVDK